MLVHHTLYPQLRLDGINDQLKYKNIESVIDNAIKKNNQKDRLIEHQKEVVCILKDFFRALKLMKGYQKYKALFALKRIPRDNMGLNVFNFLYIVSVAHCASEMVASDYSKGFL